MCTENFLRNRAHKTGFSNLTTLLLTALLCLCRNFWLLKIEWLLSSAESLFSVSKNQVSTQGNGYDAVITTKKNIIDYICSQKLLWMEKVLDSVYQVTWRILWRIEHRTEVKLVNYKKIQFPNLLITLHVQSYLNHAGTITVQSINLTTFISVQMQNVSTHFRQRK
jgi:hypothetical protein